MRLLLPRHVRNEDAHFDVRMLFFLSLLTSPELPFQEINEKISEKVGKHLRTDAGMRDGIKHIFDEAGPNLLAMKDDIGICLISSFANVQDAMVIASVFAKPYLPLLDEMEKCIEDPYLNSTGDFSGLFEDLDVELTKLEKTHSKMKRVAKKMLEGKDLYVEYRPAIEDECLKNLTAAYEGPHFAALMTLADEVNFDLPRIFKLATLYLYNVDIDAISTNNTK